MKEHSDWALRFLLLAGILLLAANAEGQGKWSPISSNRFTMRSGPASAVVGGKIYVIGGDTGTSTTRAVTTLEVYDPQTDSWSAPATTGYFRGRTRCTASSVGGKIYVIGGYDTLSGTPITQVAVFDPATSHWDTVATTGDQTPRWGHSAEVVDGKIYVLGGLNSYGGYETVRFGFSYYFDVFDPATNSWTQPNETGDFTPRYPVATAFLDGKIYLVGGVNPDNKYVTALDVYDIASNSWSTSKTIGKFRVGLYMAAQPLGGKVIAFGAWYYGTIVPMKSYDPKTDSVNLVSGTGEFTPHALMTSAVLAGKLYIFGGAGIDSSGRANEVFTPADIRAETPNNISPEFTLSPNPTNGIISVHGAPDNIRNVAVMSVLGECVMKVGNPHSSDFTIDLSKFPLGSYFVRLTVGNEVVTKMIIRN